MIRRCAGCLGLLGFSGGICSGLWAGNPTETILMRALWLMVGFAMIGAVLGWTGLLVVREHIRRREAELLPEQPETQPGEPQQQASEAGQGSQPRAA